MREVFSAVMSKLSRMPNPLPSSTTTRVVFSAVSLVMQSSV